MFALNRNRLLAPTQLQREVEPVTAAPATAVTAGSPVEVAAALATLAPAAREQELLRLQSVRGNHFVTSVLAQMPRLPGVEDPDQTSSGSTPTEDTSGGEDAALTAGDSVRNGDEQPVIGSDSKEAVEATRDRSTRSTDNIQKFLDLLRSMNPQI